MREIYDETAVHCTVWEQAMTFVTPALKQCR